MVTIWFEANGLRPDVARFATADEAERALVNLVHVRFPKPTPLRVRVTHKGRVAYSLDREGFAHRRPNVDRP